MPEGTMVIRHRTSARRQICWDSCWNETGANGKKSGGMPVPEVRALKRAAECECAQYCPHFALNRSLTITETADGDRQSCPELATCGRVIICAQASVCKAGCPACGLRIVRGAGGDNARRTNAYVYAIKRKPPASCKATTASGGTASSAAKSARARLHSRKRDPAARPLLRRWLQRSRVR